MVLMLININIIPSTTTTTYTDYRLAKMWTDYSVAPGNCNTLIRTLYYSFIGRWKNRVR